MTHAWKCAYVLAREKVDGERTRRRAVEAASAAARVKKSSGGARVVSAVSGVDRSFKHMVVGTV